MHKLLYTAALAAVASALPLAALAQTNLNLDTGATGSSGEDISWSSSSGISPVGSARLSSPGLAGSAEFSFLTETVLVGFQYSTAPIGSSTLAVNEIFAVHTNGGNYAKVMVTTVDSTSITLQFLTYNTSGTAIEEGSVTLGAPSIAAVLNNYSSVLPNAPNYGIAPGTLIVIYGSNLAEPGSQLVLQDGTKGPLPQTLNGASVSVTIGDAPAVNPAFYYAIPTQLAVVLPSTTPVGTGTITVSYTNQSGSIQTSQPAPITIVSSAFGFDSYDGALAAVTDNTDGHLITTSQSAYPGEVIVFWGSGDGADLSHDDVNPPAPPFQSLSGITALYFGNVQVPATDTNHFLYQGRSGYQGVDQINLTIPANTPTGCAVSVAAVIGSGATATVSNFVTMPIASSDGPCTDPLAYVDPSRAATLAAQNTVQFGSLSVAQDTNSSDTADYAFANFNSITGSLLVGYLSSSQPSLGSCFVTQSSATAATNPFTLAGLDAGTISVTWPNGTQPLTEYAGSGYYNAQFPAGFTPTVGEDFTFNGAGGADVQTFSAKLSFLNPLVWTNSASDGTITRTQGVTVTWTGGASGTFAQITGYSSSTGFSANFVCSALASAQSFTVPEAVLLALPPGSGNLVVSNYTNPAPFTAAGLDFGYVNAYVSTSIDATYN
ncbi:MAG: hypothetical protein ACLQPN_11685 [Bryobacteraceae bacterium]